MKNKHAKGPDGQPLISINSGRGRGRPKKNAGGVRFSQIEPTSEEFFKANDKAGGPVDPTIGFKEVYTEIYIKRAKQLSKDENLEDQSEEKRGEDGEEENKGDEDMNEGEERRDSMSKNQESGQQPDGQADTEKAKKKRGRKPKSFYLQQQQEQERMAKEQQDKRQEEMQEAENEEEVKLRADEYKSHPLFSRLLLYSEELKDYIEEKKKQHLLKL